MKNQRWGCLLQLDECRIEFCTFFGEGNLDFDFSVLDFLPRMVY